MVETNNNILIQIGKQLCIADGLGYINIRCLLAEFSPHPAEDKGKQFQLIIIKFQN